MSVPKLLLDRIRDAVQEALRGKVGAVLSGGIDSSTIVSLAGDLPTFTGYYQGEQYDERKYARLVAGREHHEIHIGPRDFVQHFDGMVAAAEPPFQGMGTFGQYMVARHIALETEVGTVLSGEGGDELFGGYARLLIVAGEPRPDGYENYQLPDGYPADLEAALHYDWERLPDLLAVDEQMMSAFGLKAVAPFMDPRVVEFVLALEPQRRVGKKLLKEAMQGIVPGTILARTDKRGFPSPLVEWTQHEPVRSFVGERLGYLPDPDFPWAREWWVELCERSKQPAKAAA